MSQTEIFFPPDHADENSSEETISAYFEKMTPELRQKWKAQYEEIIERERVNAPFYNKLTGKTFQREPMPWMVPHWKRGLAILLTVISKLNNQLK